MSKHITVRRGQSAAVSQGNTVRDLIASSTLDSLTLRSVKGQHRQNDLLLVNSTPVSESKHSDFIEMNGIATLVRPGLK